MPFSCAALALSLSGLLYLLQREVGFSVEDEGYLWYGTQAVLRGELPLRDFNSYDPGRYLWCAAWGLLLGPGISALRLSSAVFGGLGLFFGLLVASRALGRRFLLAPAGLVLALWMQPAWKIFEPAIAMCAVWIGTRLVERPDLRRHFLAGCFAGLAAFFGRNHGTYVCLGLVALITVVALRTRPREVPRRLLVWGAGVLLGYSPMILLVLFAPGFRAAFLESIPFFLQQGQLASKAAVPWPWTADYASMDAWAGVHRFGLGCAYLLVPALYLPFLVGVVASKAQSFQSRAPWMAATLIGIPYVHHASIHAAHYHLAQAYHPLLLALLSLPAALSVGRALLARSLLVGGLLVLSLAINVPALELAWKLRMAGTANALRPLQVGRDRLWVRPDQALYLELLQRAVRENVPADEGIFLAPMFPGLYCMLGRRAPTWEVYLAWIGTERSQARLVRELESVEWALVADVKPKGKEWMRLSRSNPRAWEVLERDFEEHSLSQRMPRNHLLLRRRP